MRTPEQIAEDFATRIKAERVGAYTHAVKFGGEAVLKYPDAMSREADRDASELRRIVRAWVAEAVERALRQCPVPGGLDDDLLDHIRASATESLDLKRDELATHLAATLGHIDHLHRVMHVPESQAIAEAYEAGYRKASQPPPWMGLPDGTKTVGIDLGDASQ